jgi:glycerophosphoryl diester phosphodiesterase
MTVTDTAATARPLIVAGATGYGRWPANTLEGARNCLAQDIDGIEIDVQMTADGHVVAHHDYWLSPSATRLDGAWLEARGPALKTMTLAELGAYDVGGLKPGSDYAQRYAAQARIDGARIPTLGALFDLLTAAEGPRRLFYIEIKTDPTNPDASPDADAVTHAVLDAVEAAGYAEHAKIIAFDWRVLRLSQARNLAVATAHLTIPQPLATSITRSQDQDSPWFDGADPRHHGGSDLAAVKAHGGVEWSPYFTDVTAETVAEAAALGLRVGPWGLSSAEDIARMADLGVFSITLSGAHWPQR